MPQVRAYGTGAYPEYYPRQEPYFSRIVRTYYIIDTHSLSFNAEEWITTPTDLYLNHRISVGTVTAQGGMFSYSTIASLYLVKVLIKRYV